MTGVYQIWIGDYYYFGSTGDFNNRRHHGHLLPLQRGNHSNKKMQNAFNKHKTFRFDIIIECDSRDAAYAYEQDYIDTHFGLDKCLNLNPDASKPPSTKGLTFSEETKQRMSAAFKGLKRGPQSEEHKQKIKEAKTGKKTGPRPKLQCPHCSGWFDRANLARYHNDKCKDKI